MILILKLKFIWFVFELPTSKILFIIVNNTFFCPIGVVGRVVIILVTQIFDCDYFDYMFLTEFQCGFFLCDGLIQDGNEYWCDYHIRF